MAVGPITHATLQGLGSDQRSYVVTTALGQILGPNPRRRAVIIQAPSVNHLDLFFRNQGGPAQGLRLHPGTYPLFLFYDLLGAAVQEAIYAQTDTSTETIGVVEVMET